MTIEYDIAQFLLYQNHTVYPMNTTIVVGEIRLLFHAFLVTQSLRSQSNAGSNRKAFQAEVRCQLQHLPPHSHEVHRAGSNCTETTWAKKEEAMKN